MARQPKLAVRVAAAKPQLAKKQRASELERNG
jgi:hypothetical protein